MPSNAQTEQPAPTRNQQRWRFSLRGFFFSVGALCLVMATTAALVESNRLHQENRRLRDELGRLSIEDRDRLHLIAIPRLEDLHWRWRVHVPQRDRFTVVVDWRETPDESGSKQSLQAPLPMGEFTIDLAVYRDSLGEWKLVLSHGNGATETTIPEATATDLRNRRFEFDQVGKGGTFVPEPFERMILLEQLEPEATLFGGSAEHPGATLRVCLVDLRPNAPHASGNGFFP